MVTVADIARALEAEVLAGSECLDRDVGCALASDLVSDVLVCREEKAFLLTGLPTIQVVRAAEVIDLVGVALVRGKRPAAEVVSFARDMGLPLLRTTKTLYDACRTVAQLGIRPAAYNPPPGTAAAGA